MSEQAPIIFYHSADLDGKCSAAIVLRYEEQRWGRDCELYGINYGDTFPWEKIEPERTVYMVDFALKPIEEMYRLGESCQLYWIDHHKDILEAWAQGEMEQVDRDGPDAPARLRCAGACCEVGKAGCELAWEFCYPDTKIPHAVQLLGRYDVWDEACTIVPWSHILAFQYGMRLEDTEPASLLWLTLFGEQGVSAEVDRVRLIVSGGNAVLRYEIKQNEIAANACGFEVTFEGHRALAANRGPTNSKLFESRWDPERHDIMIAFYWSRRGQWKVSLYTTKDGIDCGALCGKYGGGGHPGAAGFMCKELPFELRGGNL